jgi:hypothetical protein
VKSLRAEARWLAGELAVPLTVTLPILQRKAKEESRNHGTL